MERKRQNKGKGGNFAEVSANSLSYKGPIVSQAQKKETDTSETTLNFTGLVTSSAGGVIDSFYSDDPLSYGVADWTSLTALWHEYRVLGHRVEFSPYNRYSKTTVTCTPAIVCVDRQSSGTLGTYQVAMSHSSAKKVSWEDPWVMEAKMQNAEEAVFTSTSATVARKWIKFYSDGLSVSTVYGRFFVYVLIQFRGRK
jgi:hypothetical protein